jgi:hypothetical protein
LAAGIDMIMADLRESMTAKPEPMDHHAYALVFLVAYRRDPRSGETGCDWVQDAQAERAALLGAETATVLSNYIRVLGHSARAHSATTCDVDLARLAVKAGLAQVADDQIIHPWLKQRFGLAAVTTDMALAPDLPLAADQPKSVRMGLDWGLGRHGGASRGSHDPYARRDYAQGAHPFETLKRVETPTTYIDEPNVARVPKRTDMFARGAIWRYGTGAAKGRDGWSLRAQGGAQLCATQGCWVHMCSCRTGNRRRMPNRLRLNWAADNIKGASYFLGIDATVSRAALPGHGIRMTPGAHPLPRPMTKPLV